MSRLIKAQPYNSRGISSRIRSGHNTLGELSDALLSQPDERGVRNAEFDMVDA